MLKNATNTPANQGPLVMTAGIQIFFCFLKCQVSIKEEGRGTRNGYEAL